MEQTLSYYSTAFYRDFSAYTAEKLQELGLNYGALFFVIYVGKHPGCTPSELTKTLGLDWGHSQRSIEKLVRGGFLTKERSGGNRRTYQLALTELGGRAFQVSRQVFSDWDQEKLGVLSEDERTQLLRLLKKVAGQARES